MKASVTAIIATLVAICAFFAGRMGAGKENASDKANREASGDAVTVSSISGGGRSDWTPKSNADQQSKQVSFVSDHALTVEEARALTSEERMALITRGGMSWNSGNQIALMDGVIAALTKDEIGPATEILGGIQNRGNFQTQEVWNALWTQWGRVNPTKALEFFADDHSGKSKSDARHMMTGWLEADPLAAFAWAKQPKRSDLEAAAAALAITRNANGDPKRMEASILALPADNPVDGTLILQGSPRATDFVAQPGYNQTRSACLQDYFDLVSMVGDGQDAAKTYDQLPPALQSSGWSVALQRMILQDPQVAAEWLTTHASDPGYDNPLTLSLAVDMANQDPGAAMAWATKMPGLNESGPGTGKIHPAQAALGTWLNDDPEAASAWLRSNAADAAWAKEFRTHIGE
ncbi:MAG: hypothetical protein EOP83_00070 [Verrucomicrobiaceae bacterium]|nr:MAG: hypothetical protein EOP83_00070 [Verrucomicrobiaceae bacterium]